IGLQDAANGLKAMGVLKFKDLGNMTKPEIDGLVKIMTKYKKQGQFRAFWSTFNESVNLMSSKEVVIESMWSPAVALLIAQGINVRYAAPPEGFRGWCSAQPARDHRTRRRRQEGPGARRRLVHDPRLPLLVVELVLPREHVPGEALQRLPQRLAVDARSRRWCDDGGGGARRPLAN